jgi:hypothetical protein
MDPRLLLDVFFMISINRISYIAAHLSLLKKSPIPNRVIESSVDDWMWHRNAINSAYPANRPVSATRITRALVTWCVCASNCKLQRCSDYTERINWTQSNASQKHLLWARVQSHSWNVVSCIWHTTGISERITKAAYQFDRCLVQQILLLLLLLLLFLYFIFWRKSVLIIVITFILSDIPSNLSVLSFLCAFAKLRNSQLVSSCLSVRMEQLGSHWAIFMKFDIWVFFWKSLGHLDTGFSWFPCVYKQMLRWLLCFQVATMCFSRSPPGLKLNFQ